MPTKHLENKSKILYPIFFVLSSDSYIKPYSPKYYKRPKYHLIISVIFAIVEIYNKLIHICKKEYKSPN